MFALSLYTLYDMTSPYRQFYFETTVTLYFSFTPSLMFKHFSIWHLKFLFQTMMVQRGQMLCKPQIYCVPREQLLTFELILCTNELEVQGCESGPRHIGLCFLVKSR